jgi:hypothetical protein
MKYHIKWHHRDIYSIYYKRRWYTPWRQLCDHHPVPENPVKWCNTETTPRIFKSKDALEFVVLTNEEDLNALIAADEQAFQFDYANYCAQRTILKSQGVTFEE